MARTPLSKGGGGKEGELGLYLYTFHVWLTYLAKCVPVKVMVWAHVIFLGVAIMLRVVQVSMNCDNCHALLCIQVDMGVRKVHSTQ